MKKTFGFVCLSFSIIFLFTVVISCVINDSDSSKLPVPSLHGDKETKTFTISFQPIQNMKYANIIRESSDSEDGEFTSENIGQVFPTDKKNLPSTFQFHDKNTDPSKYYKYHVRYFDGENYIKSESTTCKNGFSSEVLFTTDPNAKFLYTRNDIIRIYSLSLKESDLVIPEEYDSVAVVISNGISTRPFIFAKKTAESASEETVEKETYIDLQKALSTEFLNKELTFEGLIGIKTDSELSGETYKNYHWTSISPVNFEVSYTDSEGLVDNDVSNFIVPSYLTSDNDFDISAESAILSIQ